MASSRARPVLCASQIIHNDDITTLERWDKKLPHAFDKRVVESWDVRCWDEVPCLNVDGRRR